MEGTTGFANGSCTWAIPMQYRKWNNTTGAGIDFATVNQVFTIDDTGTMTVTKDDVSECTVTRSPTP